MELNKVYFFTATIKNWIPLLIKTEYKVIILDSLLNLCQRNLISVYGFVIMPNHIHLIWEMLDLNGKESPHSSFLKFTAHRFLQNIRQKESPFFLEKFRVDEVNKNYSFWQRDPHDVEIYSPEIIFQKLDYIHNNPCSGKWMLSDSALKYPYSSFEFYENGIDRFGFLSEIGSRL
ncbi:transposase [Algoriphagus namhaensis]